MGVSKNKFYNKEIKERYLKTLPDNLAKRKIVNYFKRIGTYMESSYNKDLYEMTIPEIRLNYISMNEISYTQIRIGISHIKGYLLWAIENRLSNTSNLQIDELNAYDISIQKPLRKNLFKNVDDMVNAIEVVYPRSEWDNCHVVPSVICLSWLGLTMEQMLRLKNDDVDLDGRRILLDGKVFAIIEDDIIYDILEKYKNNLQGQRLSFNNKVTYFSLDDIGFFIKRLIKKDYRVGQPVQLPSFLNNTLSKFTRDYKKELKIIDANFSFKNSNIALSGKLYNWYQRELAGEIFTDDDIIKHFNLPNQKNTSTLIKDERLRFEEYKKAFWE